MSTTKTPMIEEELAYVRGLAELHGVSLTESRTPRSASSEIDELEILIQAQDQENAEGLAS